jgi:hypothetical protein
MGYFFEFLNILHFLFVLIKMLEQSLRLIGGGDELSLYEASFVDKFGKNVHWEIVYLLLFLLIFKD